MKIIFPGKFNPPHLGHAVTIMALSKLYDVTVVVTTDKPENAPFTPAEIALEIARLGVDVEVFDGTLTSQKKNPFDKPIFSGNPKVIEWAEKVGAEAHFIPRSGIISGTRIRECIK